MKKQFVAEIVEGDRVDDIFLVIERGLHRFQTPKPDGEEEYLRLVLGDKSGIINAVMWQGAREAYQSCAASPLVRVTGQVGTYREQLQLTVESLIPVAKGQVNLADFQRASGKDRRQMVGELLQLVQGLENSHLQDLLRTFFEDRSFLIAFADAPAAKSIHHAYVGGLLEHTLETASICLHLVRLYPRYLDRDLLVAGALLHDIGKVREYDAHALNFEITDAGKLFGHILLGFQMVEEALASLEGFPQDLAAELLHMILSHHGYREWGSPEPPKTMNAFALHHADYLGAQMNHFQEVLDRHRDGEGKWTSFDSKLERSLYLGFLPQDLGEE